MTSEIIILTQRSVVLAADSAVTIGDKKTFTGVNKLFKLSNNPPMGIMTYNNTDFLNIPIDSIIKKFSKQINEQDLSSLDEIKSEFESFLKDFLSESEIKYSFEEKLSFFIETFNEELRYHTFEDILDNIEFRLSYFTVDDWKESYDEIIFLAEKYEESFDNLIPFEYDDEKRNEIIFILKKFFIYQEFFENFIGIVIAGFEKKDYLPSFMHLKISYLYDEEFVLRIIEKEKVGEDYVIFKAFAQDDVIYTFLNNINDNTQDEIVNYFNFIIKEPTKLFKEIIKNNKLISQEAQIQIMDEINKIEDLTNDFCDFFYFFIEDLKKFENQTNYEYISVISNSLLCYLAEILINITSMKRKLQDDLGTVGGHIDVALITSTEGFVWQENKMSKIE